MNKKRGDAVSHQRFPVLTLRTVAFLTMTVLHHELVQQLDVLSEEQELLIWRAARVGR